MLKKVFMLTVPFIFMLGCSNTDVKLEVGGASEDPIYHTSESMKEYNFPFSEAVQTGNLLFVTGQIGNYPGTTDLAPGGIKGEAAQAMDNIKTILEANGSSMDQGVKATFLLVDISEWPAFNEVYGTYFPGKNKPARTASAGTGLAFGARCEVDVIAYVKSE